MGRKQATLFSDPAEVEQVEKTLDVTEEALKEVPKTPQKERPYVSTTQEISMTNHALVTALSDGRIQVKVVSVYVFPKCDTVPEPDDIDNEVDVWRQHLLADIDRESERLSRALSLLFRKTG